MKRLLLLLAVSTLFTSCAVNRYGRGQYEGMTKTELKSEFKNLQYTGVEDRSSIGHPINGALTVSYTDPKTLAKSEDYIVTTKTSLLDIIIGGVTGGLYSQNTVHVRSNMDGKKMMKEEKVVKVKKPSNIIIKPVVRAGFSYQEHKSSTGGLADIDLSDRISFEPNFNASVGAEISFGKHFFAIPSIQAETVNWTIDGTTFSEDNYDIVYGNASANALSLGLDILAGVRITDKFSFFAGGKGFGLIGDGLIWSYDATAYTGGFRNGERIVSHRDSGVGKDDFRSGVHFNIYSGLGYDISKNLTIDARYYLPTGRSILSSANEYSISSAQLGLTYKF